MEKTIFVNDSITGKEREFDPKKDKIENFESVTIKGFITKEEAEKIYGTKGTA